MNTTPRTLGEWLDYIEQQHPKSIDMGLERVDEVAARMSLGKPARRVVIVGGTNGKGSTVAFIEAIARAAGWKVGAYTSPHLLAYNERVRIDGQDASDAALVQAFEVVELARNPSPPNPPLEGQGLQTPLTYFEFGTLAALWLFARSDLDLVILEVGLGGRLDATNIVDADVAVITTVDLDHQDWLGDDREKIGFEKAGIARAWKPLVLGDDDPPASVLRHAYAIGASAIRAGCDFFFERRAGLDPPCDQPERLPDASTLSTRRKSTSQDPASPESDDLMPSMETSMAGQDPPYGESWCWREVGFELELPLPALAAPVQLRNAATAIAAIRALDLSADASIDAEAYARGIANARIGGRLQRFMRVEIEILVDVGHNPQAARALAEALQARPVDGRTFAVYAALLDKDPVAVVNALAPVVDGWLLAGSLQAGPRGQAVDALASRLRGTAATAAATAAASNHADVALALQAALAQAGTGDRILVFGSFHAAEAALWMLKAP